ncbi:ASCH domain-containing protein [Pigmentibacter sp. JX0631]|uniref:ASCH domain-containing protein n=1 Tax=Pigmentibacter sp. JX0631 TaxID=2976982 RepID=UPI0024685B79|nr:ASCH domain-containing protein [Pigmentibacter sp. JX0631]WGL59429.1 ASCH domain-containing protein [Pigmentibacter sp. JX0631]
MNKDKSILLSLHPDFALKILEGKKRLEFRRRFPILPTGTKVYIYATKPVGKILGECQILSIKKIEAQFADFYIQKSGDNREEVLNYIRGLQEFIVLEIRNPIKLNEPAFIQDLFSEIKRAPMSFCYVPNK